MKPGEIDSGIGHQRRHPCYVIQRLEVTRVSVVAILSGP